MLAIWKISYRKGTVFGDYLAIENIQSVKGIFILLVFASHFVQYVSLNGSLDTPYFQMRKYLGQMVVVPFLFYSGYGIEASITKKGQDYVRQLPVKRILKVLFQFDLAVLLFLLFRYCIGTTYSAKQLLLTFLAWNGIGNSNWYIFGILFLYLFSWISHMVFPRQKDAACMCLILLSTAFTLVMQEYRDDYWYNTVMAYVAGSCFYHIQPRFDRYIRRSQKRYWACLFVCILYFAIFHKSMASNVWVHQVCAALFGLIVVLITMKLRIKNPILDYCGKHLFSLYILQRLPMRMFMNTPLASHPALYFLLSIALTFPLGWIFDHVSEFLWNFFCSIKIKRRTRAQ